MFGDLLSSRWFQAGLAFFVLCVGGSLLYSWHVQRTTESEFAKRPQPVVSPLKNRSETNTAPVDFQTEGVVNTPEEHTETPMPDETEAETIDETEFSDLADAFLPDDVGTEEEAPAEEVAVSPHGFGAYPEIPAGYPFTPFWLRPPPKGNKSRDQLMRKELLSRVMVKAWTDGDHNFIGAGLTEGKVYLNYPDVIYVKYGEPYENKDGELIRPITRVKGAGIVLSPEDARNGITPPGYQVKDFDDAGYDPYTYLDLP